MLLNSLGTYHVQLWTKIWAHTIWLTIVAKTQPPILLWGLWWLKHDYTLCIMQKQCRHFITDRNMKFGIPKRLNLGILIGKGAFWKEGRSQRKTLRKWKAMWIDIKGTRGSRRLWAGRGHSGARLHVKPETETILTMTQWEPTKWESFGADELHEQI